MSVRASLTLLCSSLLLSVTQSLAQAQGKIYWTDRTPRVAKADINGANVEDLVVGTMLDPFGIELDAGSGKMYWCGKTTLHRANVDGSQFEDILGGQTGLHDLALDLADQRIYFTSNHTPYSIKRVRFDGSDLDTLVTSSSLYLHPAVDPAGGKLYWTQQGPDGIYRSNLDGTSPELFLAASAPRGIALDVSSGKIYWAQDDGELRRCNLDGTSVETLLSTADSFSELTLDLVNGKIYWIVEGAPEEIRRCNLDGSSVELVDSGGSPTHGLAVEGSAGWLFWTDFSRRDIYRASLDGSNPTVIVTSLNYPFGIAIDRASEKMYFSDMTKKVIYRADLAGTNLEEFLPTTEGPFGLAIDENDGKLYWREGYSVWRANLDGTAAESIVTGLTSIETGIDLKLDQGPGKIFIAQYTSNFWPETARGQILTSRLDGTQLQMIINESDGDYAVQYTDVAYNPTDNKIYITRNSQGGEVLRADTDGSNLEVIVTGSPPEAIVVDDDDQKIYWTHHLGNGILRANPDGSEVEMILSVYRPIGLALNKGETSVSANDGVSLQTELLQNFPNPFNPRTIIRYQVANPGHVTLRVYDARGRLVKVLEDRHRQPGRYEIDWNGENGHGDRVASGVYFYRLTAGGVLRARKMVVLN